MLSNSDLVELIAFRRDLHRRPEISGEEVETAKTVVAALRDLSPTRILTAPSRAPLSFFARNSMRSRSLNSRLYLGNRKLQARGICAGMTDI